jgi:DNA invertase Pin-like site-specific DNA recombinase
LTLRDSGANFAAVDLPEANDLTVGIMALVAQQEREAISKRTREALAIVSLSEGRGVQRDRVAPDQLGSIRRSPSSLSVTSRKSSSS